MPRGHCLNGSLEQTVRKNQLNGSVDRPRGSRLNRRADLAACPEEPDVDQLWLTIALLFAG
ncbi:hypothetical protein [Streptomyces sp. NBC_00878]|uniref:hypothetical protein n=1 Tax=Streptomyces sp. NBC_00878 TaxID=2975854 RepID=UPI0022550F6D|nr:hypothetical protein [Streptomyces sp. NBC_00878]MCX4908406.1 hypothetical protein [Streptomyces sp. NBC_00878]